MVASVRVSWSSHISRPEICAVQYLSRTLQRKSGEVISHAIFYCCIYLPCTCISVNSDGEKAVVFNGGNSTVVVAAGAVKLYLAFHCRRVGYQYLSSPTLHSAFVYPVFFVALLQGKPLEIGLLQQIFARPCAIPVAKPTVL